MHFNLFALVIVSTLLQTRCENILVLMGTPSPSHHMWITSIVNALATNENHNITVVSTDIEKQSPKNVHYIELEEVYQHLYNDTDGPKIDILEMSDQTIFVEYQISIDFSLASCKQMLKSNGMQTIINYPKDFKFDLVIQEYACGPCLLFLLEKFNYPPLIAATSFSNPPFTLDLVGGHNYYAYYPLYNLRYDTDMNFWQRCYNIVSHAFCFIKRNYDMVPKLDEIVRSYYKSDFPYLGDIERRTVLVLVNTHPALDFAEPTAPNVIPVGGLHIKEPKNLSYNLENFINQGKKGAILFSLGTNVKSNMLSTDTLTQLLNALGKMPDYNFLWKFETDALPIEVPKNVLISTWIPQNDILGHPKIKAFITHGGLLSIQEATWHAVPIIGIPFFADQQRNVHKSVTAGVAEMIMFKTINTEEFVTKVLRVVETPSYQENMTIRSLRFRDQKEKPLERAVWWIEWILRNPKPDHIKSPVLKLGFFAANIYDILLLIVTIIFLFLLGLYKLIFLFSKKTSTNKEKIN